MFDKNKEYQEHILPLVKEVLLYCDEYHIPVFMTFAVSDNGKQTEYATEMISAVAAAEKLKDDQLVKHAAVVSGFEVVPSSDLLLYMTKKRFLLRKLPMVIWDLQTGQNA